MDGLRSLLALSLSLVVVCVAQDVTTVQNDVCIPGLRGSVIRDLVTERCYEFVYDVNERRTWAEARQYCQDNSGRLVNIESADKQAWIELKIKGSDFNPTLPNFDPDIWIGAWMDSDLTWRFDQYVYSRAVVNIVMLWFNWGTDTAAQAALDETNLRMESDVCMYMQYTVVGGTNGTASSVRLPWYPHTKCSVTTSDKNNFLCEYEGYQYVFRPMASWLIVLIIMFVLMTCGFIFCAMYCLWDKIHTSYNVLQV